MSLCPIQNEWVHWTYSFFWAFALPTGAPIGGSNTKDALDRHVDAEDKGVSEFLTPGGRQKLPIINESGLYSLVLSCKRT